MMSFKLMVFLLSVIAAGIHTKAHAESTNLKTNNNTTEMRTNENKTVIELKKGVTVNTGLNFDKGSTQLNGTKASNIPKSRKVTNVDNESLTMKSKSEENTKDKNVRTTTTMAQPLQVTKVIISEAGPVDINASSKNDNENSFDALKNEENKAPTPSDQNSVKKNNSNLTDNKIVGEKLTKNNSITPTLTTKKSAVATTSTTTNTTTVAKPTVPVENNATKKDLASTVATSSILHGNNSISSTANTSAATTSTTTTTTTSTTPKPKKPTITYSVLDYPDLEKDNPELKNLLQSTVSNKLPPADPPYAQPSQEYNSNFHRGRDFILPIVSMIFIIPLVIGIMITSYRRFRDCWSTRHYRRMDFLVDGMYND